jgi:hypothetical protein
MGAWLLGCPIAATPASSASSARFHIHCCTGPAGAAACRLLVMRPVAAMAMVLRPEAIAWAQMNMSASQLWTKSCGGVGWRGVVVGEVAGVVGEGGGGCGGG